MSGDPLAPVCRHCGATNDAGSSECWLCHRRDWRGPPKAPPGRGRLHQSPEVRASFIGCLLVIIAIVCTAIGLAFRSGLYVGLLVLLPSLAILAVAIALFTICMAFT